MSWSVNISVFSDYTPGGWNYAWWYDLDTSISEALYPEDFTAVNTVVLSESGCWREETQTHDCTWACQDPESIWKLPNSTYTLHNCVAYPIIVNLAMEGYTFTSNDEEWAHNFNILISPDRLQDVPASIMSTSVISGCLEQYCSTAEDDSKPIGCSDTSPTEYEIIDADDYIVSNGSLPFNSMICQGLDAQINPDIGGIGVFISYLMQIVLVVLIWISFHITQDWTAFGTYLYLKLIRRTESSWQRAKITQKEWQGDGRKSPIRADMMDMMKNFHITQVFFMLAVQVAALIAIHNPKYLDSDSWQQFWNNVGILYDLAFGGVLPVLLVQVLLRQGGERGWFTLFASIVSVSLSVATWFRTYFFLQAGGESLLQYIKPENAALDQCAGVPPTKYCYSADWFYKNAVATTKAIPIIVFCLVVLVVMIIDQMRVFKHRHVKEPAGWKRYHQDGRNVFNLVRDNSMGLSEESENEGTRLHWKKPLHVVQRLMVFGAEAALLAFTMILLKDYGRILVPREVNFKLLDLTAWSFGQVIAVTIWFPVLCKYLWNLFETMTGLDVKRKREKRDEENTGSSKASTFSEPSKEPTVAVLERPLQSRTSTFNSVADLERQ